MEENRRQYERIPILLEVSLELASGRRECRISDLSLGGCFVDSIAHVTEDEIINLMLHLSTGQWLELKGKVTYIFPGNGFGLNFLDLTDVEKVQVEQVILDHGGKPSLIPNTEKSAAELPERAPQVLTAKPNIHQPTSKNNTIHIEDEFDDFIQDLFADLEDNPGNLHDNELSL